MLRGTYYAKTFDIENHDKRDIKAVLTLGRCHYPSLKVVSSGIPKADDDGPEPR